MSMSVLTQNPSWYQAYPPGLPREAELRGRTAHRLLSDSAARWPDREALQFMGWKITYSELDKLVSRAARGLQKLGVGPGVHVGLYLPNTPHVIISFMAVLRAGGVVVNYSPLDAERILEHKISDSETDVMVTLNQKALLPQMTRLMEHTRLKTLVVGALEDFVAEPDEVRAQQIAAGEVVDNFEESPAICTFTALTDNDGAFEPHPESDDLEALAVLQYTGGTTGAPKGAMLSQGNLANAPDLLAAALGTTLEEGQERSLAVLPPFHIYALSANMLMGFRMGATIYQHYRFDPEEVLRTIEQEKITVFMAVPTMFSALLACPALEQHDLTSLKVCNSGGAPLALELQQRFIRAAGCPVKEGWGMTETTTVGTFMPDGVEPPVGCCGLPVPGMDLCIISMDGEERRLPPGERGELCVRGPSLMKGYWKRQDATEESMTREGYFRTGDVAYMDEQGFLYIVDRTKDMIICSGYNVYPRNIEEAIYEHPAIAEVSVIGVPDEYRGQSPRAYVTIRQGETEPTLEELQAFLKTRLGRHEMIHGLEVREELPKTPVGKLSKKELYAEVGQ